MSKLWVTIGRLDHWRRLPRLPRAMYSNGDYEGLSRAERECLARVGARDKKSLKVALKRYGVDTVDELLLLLSHHKPRRDIGRRMFQALGRLFGGLEFDPHAREVREEARRAAWRARPEYQDMRRRVYKQIRRVKE